LIHIFLALAGSTEIDLGLDPTIKCIRMDTTILENSPVEFEGIYSKASFREPYAGRHLRGSSTWRRFSFPSDPRTYHITVRGEDGQEHTFETIRLTSDSGATRIYSHGTRIWEVFDINDPLKKSRVLKDTWIQTDKALEGSVVKEICDRLHGQPEKLKNLPSVLMHGAVYLSGNNIDHIFDPTRRGLVWSTRDRLPLIEERDGFSFFSPTVPKEPTVSLGIYGGRFGDNRAMSNFDHEIKTKDISRRHWRLVYTDSPGIPFHDLVTYDQILTALTGALQGQ
jgi:hypothetical protein